MSTAFAMGLRANPLVAIGAEAAWDFTTGSKNVVIAVIDTGVDFSHPDLATQAWTNTKELNGQVGVDDDGNGFVDDISRRVPRRKSRTDHSLPQDLEGLESPSGHAGPAKGGAENIKIRRFGRRDIRPRRVQENSSSKVISDCSTDLRFATKSSTCQKTTVSIHWSTREAGECVFTSQIENRGFF